MPRQVGVQEFNAGSLRRALSGRSRCHAARCCTTARGVDSSAERSAQGAAGAFPRRAVAAPRPSLRCEARIRRGRGPSKHPQLHHGGRATETAPGARAARCANTFLRPSCQCERASPRALAARSHRAAKVGVLFGALTVNVVHGGRLCWRGAAAQCHGRWHKGCWPGRQSRCAARATAATRFRRKALLRGAMRRWRAPRRVTLRVADLPAFPRPQAARRPSRSACPPRLSPLFQRRSWPFR